MPPGREAHDVAAHHRAGLISVRNWAPELASLRCLTRQFFTHTNKEFFALHGRVRNFPAGSGKALRLTFCPNRARRTAALIGALGSYRSALLAETPRPSRRRWRARDCFGPHAGRRRLSDPDGAIAVRAVVGRASGASSSRIVNEIRRRFGSTSNTLTRTTSPGFVILRWSLT